MALLLDQIEWGESLLPPAADAAWEAEVKRRRGGHLGEVDRRVAPSPWLREACLAVVAYGPSQVPQRLLNIGNMVTSQENACRYCYGANRAYMKVLGYSESFISRVERDVHVAELSDMERGFIAFCRNLARSRPRPARAERDALIALGYAPLAVQEIAFFIALGCFYNRVGLLMACPPEYAFERIANSFKGRLMGLAAPLLRWLAARRRGTADGATLDRDTLASGPFGQVVASLHGVQAAAVLKDALDGSFASGVISRPAKALMFAVVARALACRHSEAEARKLLAAEGFDAAEVDRALSTLACARLPPSESKLLPWVRDTVHYQTPVIQKQTHALAEEVGQAAVLEAIGVAALANATVRLAMLLE